MDGLIHGSLLRKLPKTRSKTCFKIRSDPAQQRRASIKVPDILAAEFSRLKLLFCATMVFGRRIAA
jgi:hypothetical protein